MGKKIIITMLYIFFPFFFILIFKVCFEYLLGEIIGTEDGWLGFLGAYFGIGGAIGGVWWQLETERKQKEEEKQEILIKEISNKKLKEGYAVVTFLILFRETSENIFFYYKNLFEELNLKKENLEIKNINSMINYELFNKTILEMDILSKNRCVELLYIFSKFSYENKILSEIINDKEEFLINYYYEISKNTNDILKEYEIIKEKKFNYIDIIYERLYTDLTNLLNFTNEHYKKYKK